MAELNTDSTFLQHVPCEACGSSDANGLYDDGHTFCFACGAYAGGEGVVGPVHTFEALPTEAIAESVRDITPQTFKHFGYRYGTYRGKTVHVAPYFDAEGRLVAQHLRTRDKEFPWVGEPKRALPFGAHCWPRTGRKIVVTEGELDCLSMSQVQGNKYPTVSIGCGAGPQVKKYIAQHRDYFLGFEEVVLMFDMDAPGREAAKAAAEVIGTRAKIAELPLKDANEMLQAGQAKELPDRMFRAEVYRPEGIVLGSSLKAQVFAGASWGHPWPWPTLTRLTYGRRLKELYVFAAATGAGKTDVMNSIAAQTLEELKEPIGVFYLESTPAETTIRIMGKLVQKPFHIPDAGWTPEDMQAAWEKFNTLPPVHIYDSFGVSDWDTIRERIRFLAHAHGVQHFFVDHLTALAAAEPEERVGLERIMAEMGGLVKELNISMYVVSHLATPEGKPHEEGGRVMTRHLKGSRNIGFWAHGIYALERDQQEEDELERHTSTFRILKDRQTGRATGSTFRLRYLPETGMLEEVQGFESPPPTTAKEAGF